MATKYKIIILIVLSLLSSWRLFRSGYPSMQDDMQVFRLEQFDRCLHDGQIPCRYIPDGGLGYGYPLFNFYSPFPYIVSEAFHLVGFSLIDSIKYSFITAAFIKTIGIYLLASLFFGTSGAFISTIIYSLAPYQAVNTFVRGAIGETWALSLLPIIFWAIFKKHQKISIIFLSFLCLSHNLTLLFALPLLFVFSIITKKLKIFLISLISSLSLCAFFLLPAFFEKNLTTVNTMTQGYFQYIIHFATLRELFISNFWGYAGSMWGPLDGLSLQIGLLQFLIPSFVFVFYIYNKHLKNRLLIISLFVIGLLAIFLTHNKSTFIWQNLPFMAYFQFPWRFLGLAVFCFSFISGGLIFFIKKTLILPTTIGIILISLLLNYNYFREDIWYSNLKDTDKLTPSEIVRQSGAGLMDYWPKYGQNFPTSYSPSGPIVVSGQVTLEKYQKNSLHSEVNLTVLSPEAIINLPTVYFPEFDVFVDNNLTNYTIEPNLGLIQINLSEGNHQIYLSFKDTLLRQIANIISLLSLGSFIIFIIREKRS